MTAESSCTSCGAPVAGMRFCTRCGTPVRSAHQPPVQGAPEPVAPARTGQRGPGADLASLLPRRGGGALATASYGDVEQPNTEAVDMGGPGDASDGPLPSRASAQQAPPPASQRPSSAAAPTPRSTPRAPEQPAPAEPAAGPSVPGGPAEDQDARPLLEQTRKPGASLAPQLRRTPEEAQAAPAFGGSAPVGGEGAGGLFGAGARTRQEHIELASASESLFVSKRKARPEDPAPAAGPEQGFDAASAAPAPAPPAEQPAPPQRPQQWRPEALFNGRGAEEPEPAAQPEPPTPPVQREQPQQPAEQQPTTPDEWIQAGDETTAPQPPTAPPPPREAAGVDPRLAAAAGFVGGNVAREATEPAPQETPDVEATRAAAAVPPPDPAGHYDDHGYDSGGYEQTGHDSGQYAYDSGHYEQHDDAGSDDLEATRAAMSPVDLHGEEQPRGRDLDDHYAQDYDQGAQDQFGQQDYGQDQYGHDEDVDATRVAPAASYDDLYGPEGQQHGDVQPETEQFGASQWAAPGSGQAEAQQPGQFEQDSFGEPAYAPQGHYEPEPEVSAYDNLFADSYYGDQSSYDQGSGGYAEQGYDQDGYGSGGFEQQPYGDHDAYAQQDGFLDQTSVDQQPVGPHGAPPPPMAPSMGYDGFSGYDGYDARYQPQQERRSDTKRWLIIAAVAAAVVALIAFAIGMFTQGGDASDQGASTSTDGGTAQQTSGGTGSAQAQAKKISSLIKASAKDKAAIGTAVNQIQSCQNIDQAISTFEDAAASRKRLASQITSIDTGKVAGADEVVTNLHEAWTKAGEADAQYAAWGKARHGSPGDCSGGKKKFAKAGRLSDASHPPKQAAAKAWNPIAQKYGLDTVEWTKL